MWNRRTYRDCIHPTRIPFATGRFYNWYASSVLYWPPFKACRILRTQSCCSRNRCYRCGCYRGCRWGLTISKEKFIRIALGRWHSRATALPGEFAVLGTRHASRLGVNFVVLAASVSKKVAIRSVDTRWFLLAAFGVEKVAIRWRGAILLIFSSLDETTIGLASKFVKILLVVLGSAGKNKNVISTNIFHQNTNNNKDFLYLLILSPIGMEAANVKTCRATARRRFRPI